MLKALIYSLAHMLYGVSINYLAVLVAMISAMVIGAAWYSKVGFAKAWMALIGKQEADLKKGASKGYAVAIIGAFVEALTLSWFIHKIYTDATAMDGVMLALAIGIGIILPVMKVAYVFEGRPWKLLWINYFNQLVTLIVMGLILGAWK